MVAVVLCGRQVLWILIDAALRESSASKPIEVSPGLGPASLTLTMVLGYWLLRTGIVESLSKVRTV